MEARLSLLVLRACEPELLARFYALLGLVFEKHQHGKGPEHFSAILNGLVFEIYPRGKEGAQTVGVRIGFAVESVDQTFAALLEAGGRKISEPTASEWGLRAVVEDSEGHRIELTQLKSECGPVPGAA